MTLGVPIYVLPSVLAISLQINFGGGGGGGGKGEKLNFLPPPLDERHNFVAFCFLTYATDAYCAATLWHPVFSYMQH